MSVTAFDVTRSSEPVRSRSRCCLQTLFVFSFLVNILLIAALAITYVLPLLTSGPHVHSAEEIRSSIFGAINPDNIATNLRIVTEEPHVAGTEANARVADKLVRLWKENGLEDVHKLSYDVLLNYPDYSSPNHLSVINAVGYTLYKTAGVSPDLLNHTNNAIEASIQWLAYSPEGTVEGQAVYCNYGRREDFERLAQLGIGDLKGKIAIMHYGKLFRGDKVKNAERMGAIGAVIYSDPMEIAQDGMDNGFPSSVWMPPEAVQRGSLLQVNGDPLTPLMPSRRDFHEQYNFEEAKGLHMFPAIPVLPLSYGDALHILSRLDGEEVPQEWRGGLNFTQRLGPKLKWGMGSKLRVEVHSKTEVRQINNVIGYVRGSEAPDEWVLVGNHFDAWVFGAIDPNSGGTAILTEMGRAFAETVRTKKWRPKRTLVFCQWDAEEFGLIGSTEFVEEFATLLQERAVVYLNVDLISDNKTLEVNTVPSLYNAVTEAAKLVKNPMAEERNNGRTTVYDTWLKHRPSRTEWLPETPHMELPNGGSDHMSFLSFLGIPVVDFTYHNSSTQYPLYHTRYEVPFVNEHLFDVNHLAVHKAVGEYWAELARSFADSPLLPISAAVYSKKLHVDYVRELNASIAALSAQFPGEVEVAVEQMDKLAANVHQFDQRAMQFEEEARKCQSADKPKLDWANRRLRVLEQCFVNPAMGLVRLGEPEKRHVLYSISSQDQYSAAVMAAVGQRINQVAQGNQTMDRQNAARELALELTVIQQAVLCATNTLSSIV